MAGNNRRSGERVLGSGHLVGLFLAVVVLCCVFYTLGYVMGRSQEATVRAAVVDDSGAASASSPTASPTRVTPANLPPSANPQTSAADVSPGGEWDFNARDNSAGNGSGTLPGDAPAAAGPEGGIASAGERSGMPANSSSNSARPASSAPAVQPSPTPSAMKHAAPAVVPTPPISADRFSPPLISHGSIILQVAALKSESDALAMAGAIQNKNFPAFVVMPGADKFYRVQVGPYADAQSAKSARKALDNAGFKSIFKH